MASKTNQRGTRARRVAQVTFTAALAMAIPGLAHAGCTGFTSGDMTHYSCSDGTSFVQQKVGDFTYISGDLSGWGTETGGVGYWEVERTRVPGVGGLGAGVGTDVGGEVGGAPGWGVGGD